MNVIEFHPDDLLDRELRGQLSAAERTRLADHLARCSTCRLERMMRDDFAVSAEPLRVSPDLASFVSAAMSQARAENESGEAPPNPAKPVKAPRSPRSRLRGLLLVAALLGVSAVALARTGWVEDTLRAVTGQPARLAPSAPRTPRPARMSAAAVTEPPATRRALPERQVPAVAAHDTTPTSHARRRPAPEPALALFNGATRLRRAGDVDGAVAAYHELAVRYPRSLEAQRTPVLVGRLLLDVGRAAPALAAFDVYLAAHQSALREDALAGRARALDQLGRVAAAQRAYTQLLREFPRSSYAAWMGRQRD